MISKISIRYPEHVQLIKKCGNKVYRQRVYKNIDTDELLSFVAYKKGKSVHFETRMKKFSISDLIKEIKDGIIGGKKNVNAPALKCYDISNKELKCPIEITPKFKVCFQFGDKKPIEQFKLVCLQNAKKGGIFFA